MLENQVNLHKREPKKKRIDFQFCVLGILVYYAWLNVACGLVVWLSLVHGLDLLLDKHLTTFYVAKTLNTAPPLY